MNGRADLPRVKPKEEQSILNHEAGKWAVLGGLFAQIATLPMLLKKGQLKTINWIVLGGTVVGGLLGGITGKKTQEQEQVEGRVVREPGYWNKGILSGMAVSSLIEGGFFLATGKTFGFMKSLALEAATMTVGSVWRNKSLERDFNEAVHLQQKTQHDQQALIQKLLLERQAAAPAVTVNVAHPAPQAGSPVAAPVVAKEETPDTRIDAATVQHEAAVAPQASEQAVA